MGSKGFYRFVSSRVYTLWNEKIHELKEEFEYNKFMNIK